MRFIRQCMRSPFFSDEANQVEQICLGSLRSPDTSGCVVEASLGESRMWDVFLPPGAMIRRWR